MHPKVILVHTLRAITAGMLHLSETQISSLIHMLSQADTQVGKT